VQGDVKYKFLRIFETKQYHGDMMGETEMLVTLVDLDRAVKNGKYVVP
jgi:hypothetical protein